MTPHTEVVVQTAQVAEHAAHSVGAEGTIGQLVAWVLIAAFALFPVFFVVVRLFIKKGINGEKLTIGERFNWERFCKEFIQLIPEYPGGGEWAGVFLHTTTVAAMTVFEIYTKTLTPLEAVAGIGTLGLLASLLVRFHEFSIISEQHDRILIQYGAVIGFGCVSAILIAHIYAGTGEVGVAIFLGAQMAVAGLVGFNHFSGGSRGVRKGISHMAHFPVGIDRFLGALEMQKAPEIADDIRSHLTNRWYQSVVGDAGLLDRGLDFLYQSAERSEREIAIPREQWHKEFMEAFEDYRLGGHGPIEPHHEEHEAHVPIA